MLFQLISWIILVVSGSVVGCVILGVTKSSVFPHFGDRMIAATWLGLVTLATALLGLSIVRPLSPAISFGLIAVLTAGAASTKGVRRDLRISLQYLTRSAVLSIGILAVIASLDSSGLVEAFDTGLYHYQLTRWLSEYGTIRGLALIHSRFGFSSSWFALAAPFDFGPFQGRVSGLVGGLAIFMALFHFALVLSRIFEHRAVRADWFLAGGYTLILPVCFSWKFEVSLSPDVPVWILTLLIGWLMLFAGHPRPGRDSGLSSILPLILALAATTLKLSAIPLVVIAALFYWFNSTVKWSTRLVFSAIASLAVVPVLVANIVSSGCPFFPNSVLCLNVPWGIGKTAAQLIAADITNWARWGGPAPSGATAQNWILPWISHLDKMAVISFCGVCLLGFLTARGWRAGKSFLYVLGLSLVGTLFVFITAPNPRFGAGYLALYPALFLAAIGPQLRDLLRRRSLGPNSLKGSTTLAYVLLTLAGLVTIQGFAKELQLRRKVERLNLQMPADSEFLCRLVLPPTLPRSSGNMVIIKNRRLDDVVYLKLVTERSNGIEYRRPLNGDDQCWAAALPCLPTSIERDVYLRYPGNGLRSGFIRGQFP